MNNIKEKENKMWQAVMHCDKAAFSELVSGNAVMVCGGYRCSGAEYAGFVEDFGISDYEISCFETVLETDEVVQVHYVVRTVAASPENDDLAGLFNVTSTWACRNGEWKLVFNMDSRLMEEA